MPAKASIEVTFTNDVSVTGEARMGERPIAQLTWSSAGRLLHMKPYDREGRPHGVEIERNEVGGVSWCARWVRGKMHGPVIHLDGRGRPLTVSEFVRGRGVDIWTNCGNVTEFREMIDGVPSGLERWGDPTRPWCEGFFFHGKRHGVFREWESTTGKLQAGFPRFFLADKRVSLRAYEIAQRTDAALRKYDPSEDLNRRAVPTEVHKAIRRAKDLREVRDVLHFGGALRGGPSETATNEFAAMVSGDELVTIGLPAKRRKRKGAKSRRS